KPRFTKIVKKRKLKLDAMVSHLKLEELKVRQGFEEKEQELKRMKELAEAEMKVKRAAVSLEIYQQAEEERGNERSKGDILEENLIPSSSPSVNEQLQENVGSSQHKVVKSSASVPETTNFHHKEFQPSAPGPLPFAPPQNPQFLSNSVATTNGLPTNAKRDNPDESRRLQLLIQHCSGKAREAIESCVSLPHNDGYHVAKETLYENFGKPHVIAEAHTKKLMNLPSLKNGDGPSLLQFARYLETAQRTLTGMGSSYVADLDHMHVLRELAKKLPMYLRSRWTEYAGNIFESRQRPRFEDFLKFIKQRAKLVNNEFGRDMNIPFSKPRTSVSGKEYPKQLIPPSQRLNCEQPKTTKSAQTQTGAGGSRICLGAVPVRVRGINGTQEVQTYALLDNGSEVTLCDERLARKLNIDGENTNFTLTGINGSVEVESQLVDIVVMSLDGSTEVELQKVKTVKEIPISNGCVPRQADVNKWPHLRDMNIPELEDRNIMLLIGLKEKPRLFLPLECKEGGDGEPIAIRYSLGWTVMGPVGDERENDGFSVNFTRVKDQTPVTVNDDILLHQLQRLWNTDFKDLKANDKVLASVEDERALHVMEKSVKLVNGHFQVALPWRKDPPDIPNDKIMAERRLRSLKNRLAKDTELFIKYTKAMQDYIDKGHAQKPDKTRIVFDCAAKFNGESLNQHLLTGPDLANSLVGVIIRFRQESIAVVADIESMFYQVLVEPKDCDKNNGSKPIGTISSSSRVDYFGPLEVKQVTKICRIATCLIAHLEMIEDPIKFAIHVLNRTIVNGSDAKWVSIRIFHTLNTQTCGTLHFWGVAETMRVIITSSCFPSHIITCYCGARNQMQKSLEKTEDHSLCITNTNIAVKSRPRS
ncbi:Hypothetical predicted protein, partial [Paramuricea clavata]